MKGFRRVFKQNDKLDVMSAALVVVALIAEATRLTCPRRFLTSLQYPAL